MAKHTIEVDDATTAALEASAAERGVTISQVVADLVAQGIPPPADDIDAIAELDRRWDAVDSEGAVASDEVARWLSTWGKSTFKPWPDR